MQAPASESPTKRGKTIEDYIIKHQLGRGAYGDVFLAIRKSDGSKYAIKMVQKSKLRKENKEYQAHVEKELLSKFNHPGIVKLKSAFTDSKFVYLVLEYCEGRDFITFITLNLAKLSQPIKVFYIAEIINVLEYLHTNGVTHRDLKPENLMLDAQGHLKLIDFGTAQISRATIVSEEFKSKIEQMKGKGDLKQLELERDVTEEEEVETPRKKERRSTFVGTCYYISPELLEQNYCPPSADLWALGCILYQLYYMETPFKDSYEFAVFEKIKKAQIDFPISSTITEEAIDLINRLLVKDPCQRLGSGATQELTFEKLKEHAFFKGVNVDDIYSSGIPEMEALSEPQLQKEEQQEQQEKINRSKTELLKMMEGSESMASKDQIVMEGIVEKKAFMTYKCYYLVIKKGLSVIRVKSEEPEKRREQQIAVGDTPPAKKLDQTKFELIMKEKSYVFRSEIAGKWVAAINSEYERIRGK